MLPYTPVPTKLPASINQPQDAIDDVVVATVNPQDQVLADGIAWLQLAADTWASLQFDDLIPPPSGDPFSINPVPNFGGSGFVLTPTQIQVPSAGTYVVALDTFLQADDTTNPLPYYMSMVADIVGVFGRAMGVRYSASASNLIHVSGTGVVPITNPSTQKISFINSSAAPANIYVSPLPFITIVRIN